MELEVPRERIFKAVRVVADLLVTGMDEQRLREAAVPRVAGQDLRRVLRGYRAEFVPLPNEAIDALAAARIVGIAESWWVTQDLWSTEGRTDLQLRMEAEDTDAGVVVSIDDLLVP